MNRRDFILHLLAAGASAALFPGCDRGERPDDEETEAPRQQEELEPEATVAIVTTDHRAEGIHRAAELIDTELRGRRVFLSPDFRSRRPPPVTTHNDALRALVRHLHSRRASRITVGSRSHRGSTREVMQKKQIFSMSNAYDFETVVLDEQARAEWNLVEREDHHWERGIPLPRAFTGADAFVQLCGLKARPDFPSVDMALADAAALLPRTIPGEPYDYAEELESSEDPARRLAELNELLPRTLVVIDAFDGIYDGESTAEFGVTIAGDDPVAVDAVGAALLRRHGAIGAVADGPIDRLSVLRESIERRVGTADATQIEFLTPDEESRRLADDLREILEDQSSNSTTTAEARPRR